MVGCLSSQFNKNKSTCTCLSTANQKPGVTDGDMGQAQEVALEHQQQVELICRSVGGTPHQKYSNVEEFKHEGMKILSTPL